MRRQTTDRLLARFGTESPRRWLWRRRQHAQVKGDERRPGNSRSQQQQPAAAAVTTEYRYKDGKNAVVTPGAVHSTRRRRCGGGGGMPASTRCGYYDVRCLYACCAVVLCGSDSNDLESNSGMCFLLFFYVHYVYALDRKFCDRRHRFVSACTKAVVVVFETRRD